MHFVTATRETVVQQYPYFDRHVSLIAIGLFGLRVLHSGALERPADENENGVGAVIAIREHIPQCAYSHLSRFTLFLCAMQYAVA
jgi:hypothetical protein